jgi:hypothetical protein
MGDKAVCNTAGQHVICYSYDTEPAVINRFLLTGCLNICYSNKTKIDIR